MPNHKTVVCQCGKQISTCRCSGPKQVVMSTEPCKHSQIGPSSISVAGLTVASSEPDTGTNHPANAGINLRQENEFLLQRLRTLASGIGLRIDPLMLTTDAWASAIRKYRLSQRQEGALQFAQELIEELEDLPQEKQDDHFGAVFHYSDGRDRERQSIIQRIRTRADKAAKN